MSFDSPFLDKSLLLYGQDDTNNCVCDSDSNSYCLTKGNSDWRNLHNYYANTIVPKI